MCRRRKSRSANCWRTIFTSVIHSQCELGIEPIFWPKLEGEEGNLLPMIRQ
jgi:hypothetical protein